MKPEGPLFGLPLGVAAVLAGATAGAALAFALGRWLGHPVVARYTGNGRLSLDGGLPRAHLTTASAIGDQPWLGLRESDCRGSH